MTIVSDIEGQVYDGDTILDVAVGLPVEVKEAIDSEYPVQIWPGIYQDGTSVYAQVDLRILGIDAPEHRVSTRLSDEERARIKALAAESEQYLETLLNMSLIPGLIIVDRPQYGKYVGRVVADVKIPVLMAGEKIVPLSAVKGGESYIELSVTDAMLEAGMAEVYDD